MPVARLLTLLIRQYQRFLSPLLPQNTCRFHPSCSQYAIDSIQKYGSLRGVLYSLLRIGKCHPLHPGGYDPA